jgi:hypothetical protein
MAQIKSVWFFKKEIWSDQDRIRSIYKLIFLYSRLIFIRLLIIWFWIKLNWIRSDLTSFGRVSGLVSLLSTFCFPVRGRRIWGVCSLYRWRLGATSIVRLRLNGPYQTVVGVWSLPCRTGLQFAWLRASASHCQIDCQISFGNCHLNFRDAETRQN